MSEKKQSKVVGRGQKRARIQVTPNGPYVVTGIAEITEQFIMPNDVGASWEYRNGRTFATEGKAVSLCRCGRSRNKPFCDGSHAEEPIFQGQTRAPHEHITEGAKSYKGPNFTLIDKEMLCAFARFCDAFGGVWRQVREGTETGDALAIREVQHCPSGRLMIIDNQTGRVIEEAGPQRVTVLEDPALGIGGPIYAKGGIRVIDEAGKACETRARQPWCRCGRSGNKPFCDGSHAAADVIKGVNTNRRRRG